MTTTPTPCPGPCNNAWRRAEKAFAETGTEHAITPVMGEPAHCGTCVDRTRERLAELPPLLADVRREGAFGTRTKTTGTIGRASVASWPGQASRLLVDRIVGEMAELQADILKARGIWNEDRQPARSTAANETAHIRAIVGSLMAHCDWAMQHHPAAWEPWGRDNANPGGQIAGWHRAGLVFTKQDEQREVRRLAPCPRCRGPWLVESRDLGLDKNDQVYIECRDPDCQRVMTRSEYNSYVKELNASIQAAA
jgi:hypothetical protein